MTLFQYYRGLCPNVFNYIHGKVKNREFTVTAHPPLVMQLCTIHANAMKGEVFTLPSCRKVKPGDKGWRRYYKFGG